MRRAHGFTLIEMVSTIVILGVVAALAVPAGKNAFKADEATRSDAETLDKLRYALERLAREMREVKYDSTNGYLFTQMDASAPVFIKYGPTYSTTDPTVTISQGSGKVRLMYSVPAFTTAPVLTDQLSSLSFKYYDATGTTETSSTTDVRYVEIKLILVGSHTFEERVRVGLRNQ